MSEDDRGLKMTGKLAIKTQRGAEAYALLQMQPRPALNGLSIGFRAKDFELHGKGNAARRTLKEIQLVEVSLVTFPADKFARVVSVKAGLHTDPLPEPKPEFTMRDLAWADYLMLSRTMTKGNRNYN